MRKVEGWYKSAMAKVSAILPLYKGIKYIGESIESIISQTYEDWELIVVSEYGNNDGSAEAVKRYARGDARIHLIQNTKRLGLAESLNTGIRTAVGDYIARVDVDDPSYPERFDRQVRYLEEHPDVFLCGTLQRSVLPERSYIQEAPTDPEELKAALLFGCEISHCSVMFRRSTFLQCGMYYDAGMLGEDYDLWTRIMFQHKLVNLPEVLVDHRWGFENISLEKGEALHREVRQISARCLKLFGVELPEENLVLVSGWRNKPQQYAHYHKGTFLSRQADLLIRLYQGNQENGLIDPDALRKIIFKRWNWVCECAGIFYPDISYTAYSQEPLVPKVSIVLPVYESVKTLRETLDSILLQEMREWELVIVCEGDSYDGSIAMAAVYELLDSRVRVLKSTRHLGLAESLNWAVREARTDLIARIDADDLANAKRIGTQYAYMEQHPETGICQTYQHYFGTGANDFVHMPPIRAEEMKAKLLFFCDACHSTVMFRKSIFEKYDLSYSEEAALEDYELWTRAVRVTAFTTIPEIYGEYRVGGDNISPPKQSEIENNVCEIVSRQLRENLDINVPADQKILLNGWSNEFLRIRPEQKEMYLWQLQNLLYEVWDKNRQIRFYEETALLQAIAAKWRWARYNEPWQGTKKVKPIGRAIDLTVRKGRVKMAGRVKRIVRSTKDILQRIHLGFAAKEIAVLHGYMDLERQALAGEVERWTWERYERTESLLKEIKQQNERLTNQITRMEQRQNLIPYYRDEKVRIVFLFQVASFWPSWESFYEACAADERMDVQFVFLDETATEDVQMQSAEAFLKEKNLDYVLFQDFDLEGFRPHIMVIQTPYDNWHRKPAHWSVRFSGEGIRLVYIPYGIEISDTEDSHYLHFNTSVIENCWRIYTFSDRMKKDYQKYAHNGSAVRALGLPKFDRLYDKKLPAADAEIERKRNGRKVVLWKLHFPKAIVENGRQVTVTPELPIYIEFARHIKEFSDFFFIFMPHPRFLSKKMEAGLEEKVRKLFEIVEEQDNVYIDMRDDYREALIHADYIIIDRSAVMVEAGALDVPVLYMSNADYYEPVTEAIKPLIDSYYQGNSAGDMTAFLERCRSGWDPGREARRYAFKQCIPYFDGKCGERIKEDIIRDLENNVL